MPLYYTGLTDEAKVSVMGAKATTIRLNCERMAKLEVTIPAEGMGWYVITEAGRCG